MQDSYHSRRAYADDYLAAQLTVLSERFNVPTTQIEIADDLTDRTEATDAIIDNTRIALRVRKPDQLRYSNQFTIRTTPGKDGLSEWDKVRAGLVRYMLYAFAGADGGLSLWTLVDLSKIKRSAAEERRYVGGSFLAFRLDDCRAAVVAQGTATRRKDAAPAAAAIYSPEAVAEADALYREAVDDWHRWFQSQAA